ncbi:NAD(P)/FAD-dependent oxidoreductase [Olsenella sp. HMSC062G07]|uniref:NAD(P)/FAD-dependent oxidoreductase n=1 Tax=Olsenella sp. HMSC062G07 TaxID=1739330 RepID=UPI0008A1F180|nr:NAD(P)/FAD-dependent oxidoreductase [Olsenella sp. HMSC062G07]OFK22408.1 FAD/NAD(P)-binding oxidoreductase [Olsenella sp. HMSC062G07]
MTYDVIVIGAGVSGSAVARELSRYEAEILVMDRADDVCCGTSKANSAIVHAGYDCMPGSMMARMNVRGNEMMEPLARDLDVPFERTGSLLVCTSKERLGGLRDLFERGAANGVPGLKIISGDEARAMEPQLTDAVVGALWAPSAGIINVFLLNIALAENAFTNGVDFHFNTRAERLWQDEGGVWHIRTNNGEYRTRAVINAAGVYADRLHNMVSATRIHITPRRGEYFLLDRTTAGYVRHVVFPQPTELGKGVLVTPTVDGNTLVGPTAFDLADDQRDDVETTQAGLDTIREKASENLRDLPLRQVITSFAGLRAHEDRHEFVLGHVEGAPGFYDCAGIESPGLTSAPAIGEYLGGMIKDDLGLSSKDVWVHTRTGTVDPSLLTLAERNELIRREPAYGQIVCRCESVSEGEILDAIRRPLGARDLDGVKRRVRAGAGRCQAGFCSPRVMDILSRELGLPLEEIRKSGGASRIVVGRTKEVQGQ